MVTFFAYTLAQISRIDADQNFFFICVNLRNLRQNFLNHCFDHVAGKFMVLTLVAPCIMRQSHR